MGERKKTQENEKSPHKEKSPQEKGTSRERTLTLNLIHYTLLELEKVNIKSLQWEKMVEGSKGKQKEDNTENSEQQLQCLQEKLQIMKMQGTHYNKKLMTEK
jgi:hypothetical protein